MMNKPGAHILVEHVSHRYRAKGEVVLDDIHIEVQPGEALAMIGRSGCGKSTLLHIMAGLNKPAAGAIWIDGRRVEAPSPRWVMMFQQPSLYPWMSVAENAGIGLRFAGKRKTEIRDRVMDRLTLVGLEDYADANSQDLSGGQQQRVALARSLAMEPELLLLDEPFSALDAFTRASLQRDVRAIAKQLGITLVLVTHDIDEAVLMADRALIMSAKPGRIRDSHAIDLPDPRDRKDPAVKAGRDCLMTRFGEIAGADLGDVAEDFEEPAEAPEDEEQAKAQTRATARTAI